MMAAVLEKYKQDLTYKEVPKPVIVEPDDIIVRIAGTGICKTDIHELEGFRTDRTSLPLILGHENVGFIDDFGNGVSGFSRGKPVALYSWITCGYCDNCRKGNDVFCTGKHYQPGIEVDGGYAEFIKTKVRALVPLPEKLSIEELSHMAPLSDAGITAYHAIKKLKHLYEVGSSAVVIGAGGGLGHIAVQMLKTMTMSTVIAVDSSEKGVKLAEELGVDHGIVAGPDGGVKEVLSVTNGKGADVVFDFVGDGEATNNALKMTKKQGTLSIIGNGGNFTESTHDMIIREINIVGNLTGTYLELKEVLDLYLDGKFKIVGPKYKLNQVNMAIADLMSGRIQGRAYMVP